MITFYDETGKGYGAQVELKTKNAVNGERSISGTIVSNKQVLSRLDRGWSFTFDGELYKIIYAKPKDEGKNISLSFDAVHQFFYDFEHSNCYQEFNGSNRFEVYIEAIFKNSGYRYVIEAEAKAIRKENFGNASRLKMFKDIIKAAGLEFSVTGKVVRILKKVGTDLSTVVRKNFNMNELTIEKNIGNFITYKKGLGAWKDENNHDAGRYTSEYESPLAQIYGRIEGEPVTDERYKETGKLLERLKKEVDESYSISVQLGMEDLTQAGYKYTRPRAGDYIMAINETIGFREKIRIVSYESSYDVTGRLLSHKVTCNDIGTVQKAITSEGSIMRSVSESKEYAEGALEVATRALVSANGKNTNYYGATKPKDEPRGTLHEGDLLYLTVGEETELYYWSGTEWLPKILKVDTTKLEKLFNDTQVSTNQAIAQANAKAEDALKKAGTLPDMPTLSEQIKAQVMNSEEFNHLSETSKLYERVIGQSETDMPDKLSRLVMGSQIFQTEVGRFFGSETNYLKNSNFSNEGNYWRVVGANNLGINYQHSKKNLGKLGVHFYGENIEREFYGFAQEVNFNASTGDKVAISFDLAREGSLDFSDIRFGLHFKKNGEIKTQKWRTIELKDIQSKKYTRFEFVYDIPLDIDSLNVMFYGLRGKTINIYLTEVKIEKNSKCSPWTPNPQDIAEPIEAVRTQMTQLAGSWAVKNLNSNGDVLNSINVLANGTNRIDGRLTHITGQTVIDEAVIDGASIKSLSASKLSGGEADFKDIKVINFDAKNVTSGTFTGLTFRGGRIEALNGKMYIDLQNGQYNVLNDEATIRRIEGTSSSQFIKLMKSGFVAERVRDPNAAMMVFGTNHDKTEKHDNETFAGIRLWSGKGNGTKESLTEFVGDRVLIYNNGRYRSPWNFHGNTNDGNTYLIPMNQNNVKHYIGRGDFFVEGIYAHHFYMSGGVDVKQYLWDLLTCFGIMKRYNAISGAASGHIQGVLDKYGFR